VKKFLPGVFLLLVPRDEPLTFRIDSHYLAMVPLSVTIELSSMSVLFISAELMFVSRVSSVASTLGTQLHTALSGAKGEELLATTNPSIVVVDLSAPGVDIEKFMMTVRAMGQTDTATTSSVPKVVAFAPHVHEQKLAAAKAAGCDAVLSRGQFDRSIADVLSGKLFA
jgi:CheY-like chemotaxis protein